MTYLMQKKILSTFYFMQRYHPGTPFGTFWHFLVVLLNKLGILKNKSIFFTK